MDLRMAAAWIHQASSEMQKNVYFITSFVEWQTRCKCIVDRPRHSVFVNKPIDQRHSSQPLRIAVASINILNLAKNSSLFCARCTHFGHDIARTNKFLFFILIVWFVDRWLLVWCLVPASRPHTHTHAHNCSNFCGVHAHGHWASVSHRLIDKGTY